MINNLLVCQTIPPSRRYSVVDEKTAPVIQTIVLCGAPLGVNSSLFTLNGFQIPVWKSCQLVCWCNI